MSDLEKRLSALEHRLAETERELRLHAARAEIENLMARHQYYYAAGLGARIMDELWTVREDAAIEYGASGVYEGLWKVRRFYVKEQLPGRLSTYALTTQVLEVGEDGDTAWGLWLALGTETDAGDLGPAPPAEDDQRRMLLCCEDENGRRYRAEWLWQKVEVSFRREGGRWRIHRLHVTEYFRCPFDQDWVRYATRRYATDGMWLESLFESPLPLPPEAHGENLPSGSSTAHWQYAPNVPPVLLPEPGLTPIG